MDIQKKLKETSIYLNHHINHSIDVGIVIGTGLEKIKDIFNVDKTISYEKIPNFNLSTIDYQKGELVFADYHKKKILLMNGRFHYYEGYSMQEITFPIRVMKELGIRYLILTNASGALNPVYNLSDIIVVDDHINLQNDNPIRYKHIEPSNNRFVDMYDPYDKGLIGKVEDVAHSEKLNIYKGVYVCVQGPILSTKAEYRYLRKIGADLVGMSTVPEVIVSKQLNIKTLTLSVITDLCYPSAVKPIDIDDILNAAKKSISSINCIIANLLNQLD